MPDREKVIKGLEVCTASGSNCDGCPYFEPVETILCACPMMDDALALLREQEPVKPQKMLDGVWSYERCGACGNVLYERGFAYCPWCGKAVKWDATD